MNPNDWTLGISNQVFAWSLIAGIAACLWIFCWVLEWCRLAWKARVLLKEYDAIIRQQPRMTPEARLLHIVKSGDRR